MRRFCVLLTVVACCCAWPVAHGSRAQQQRSPLVIEEPALAAWNKLVANIDAENTTLTDLQETFRKNRPGAVLLVGDMRTSLRERRLRMIDDELKIVEERMKILRELRKAEAQQ